MITTRFTHCLLVAAALIAGGCEKPNPTPATPPAAKPPPPLALAPAMPALTMPPGHPSLTSNAPALPPGHPPLAMNAQALPPGTAASVENPQWKVPDGWQPGKGSSVRRASFIVTTPTGQSADIAITVFPGDVGGMLANINRWRGQIGLDPITDAQAGTLTTTVAVDRATATVVDFTGDAPPAGKTAPQRMIVATLEHEGNSWFIKLTGDAPLVETQRLKFLEFVQSVRF